MTYIIVLKTLVGAFLWAAFGFLSRQEDESFQPEKLLTTLCAAIMVAFLNVAWGIDPGVGESIFIYFIMKTGFIGVIDKLLKFVWRRLGLKKWWESLEIR